MARFTTLEELMDYVTLDSSGNVNVPQLKVSGSISTSAQVQTLTITSVGTTGAVSLDPTLGQVFTITPSGSVTINAAAVPTGARISIIVTTSGTSSYNITFGTSFKSTGVLATGTSDGKVFTANFISDGVNFNETSRTTAM